MDIEETWDDDRDAVRVVVTLSVDEAESVRRAAMRDGGDQDMTVGEAVRSLLYDELDGRALW